MNKELNKYDANFTAGGLLFNEFKSLEFILKDRLPKLLAASLRQTLLEEFA